MAVRPPAFDLSVFVNCPFDEAYKPLLGALLFAIHDCGFRARIALEATGSGETRLDKIARIIRESRYSVHDISRVELSPTSPLPRFNMPFECGLAFGALLFLRPPRFGPRDVLLLAAESLQDRQTLSDLAGQDADYHRHEPEQAIKAVRRFLASKAEGVLPDGFVVRGHDAIHRRYLRFQDDLPALARSLQISAAEIATFDYLADWIGVAVRWQAAHTE